MVRGSEVAASQPIQALSHRSEESSVGESTSQHDSVESAIWEALAWLSLDQGCPNYSAKGDVVPTNQTHTVWPRLKNQLIKLVKYGVLLLPGFLPGEVFRALPTGRRPRTCWRDQLLVGLEQSLLYTLPSLPLVVLNQIDIIFSLELHTEHQKHGFQHCSGW